MAKDQPSKPDAINAQDGKQATMKIETNDDALGESPHLKLNSPHGIKRDDTKMISSTSRLLPDRQLYNINMD